MRNCTESLKKEKKLKTSASSNHFENMFELMVGPMLGDKAFISKNPICLVFCKIAFACKWNGMQILGRILSHQLSLYSLFFIT